jgi:hypothetical protein
MPRHAFRLVPAAILLGALAASPARAGVYADELSKCLVGGAGAKDKTNLVRWVFANSALHPELASVASFTSAQRTEINRTVGRLFERLLTESCRAEFRDAMSYEGPQTIEMSFSVLGQVAMRELMSHPEVAKGFGELESFISEEKISAAAKASPEE